MQYEESDEPIVAMKVEPMKPRTDIERCWGRLGEDKTRPMRRGSGQERVEVRERDNIGRKKKNVRKVVARQGKHAIWEAE